MSDDLRIYEVRVPPHEVCAFCCDVECDGVACIATLDPDSEVDRESIEHLHALLRAGTAYLGAARVLGYAEDR